MVFAVHGLQTSRKVTTGVEFTIPGLKYAETTRPTRDAEFDDGYTYDRYFETPEQVAEYCDAAFANHPGHPNFRSPKPGLPVVYAMPN